MAYIGGLLGLFAGISALSTVEILYFFFVNRISTNKVHPNESQSKRNACFRYLTKYLKESSVHSFNFMANEKRIFEKLKKLLMFRTFSFTPQKLYRLFWLFFFLLAMFGFERLSYEFVQRHQTMSLGLKMNANPAELDKVLIPHFIL